MYRLMQRTVLRRAWNEVIPFLDYPPEVRRLIYTTNAIEALNSKIRRAVRTRGHFPSDETAGLRTQVNNLFFLICCGFLGVVIPSAHVFRSGALIMESAFAKPRLATLLDHFSAIEDPRVSWRVIHPLPEVLLLVVCGSIASCDDFDDIVAWGEAHLDFLRRFLPFEHGVPCGRWLNMLMNRIDPDLFSACFMSWACTLRDDAPDLIALDGKTSRRSHDRSAGKAALHLVCAFATSEKLVLGQEAVSDKSNETTAIPALLERLAQAGALEGALVTIDAIACNPKIAGDIVTHQADYLLAVKQNQPTLHGEIKDFFDTPSEGLIDSYVENDKGHGRIEQRRYEVSHTVDWITGTRRFPGEHRFFPRSLPSSKSRPASSIRHTAHMIVATTLPRAP